MARCARCVQRAMCETRNMQDKMGVFAFTETPTDWLTDWWCATREQKCSDDAFSSKFSMRKSTVFLPSPSSFRRSVISSIWIAVFFFIFFCFLFKCEKCQCILKLIAYKFEMGIYRIYVSKWRNSWNWFTWEGSVVRCLAIMLHRSSFMHRECCWMLIHHAKHIGYRSNHLPAPPGHRTWKLNWMVIALGVGVSCVLRPLQAWKLFASPNIIPTFYAYCIVYYGRTVRTTVCRHAMRRSSS